MHVPRPKNDDVILSKLAPLEHKLELLTLMNEGARAKINHFDNVRQVNLRYSVLFFSALMVSAITLDHIVLRSFIVIGLTFLMVVLLLQDKRLHRITHAFRGTTYRSFQAMAYLLGGGSDDVTIRWYDNESAKTAEKVNYRLLLYWFMVIASGVSFIPLCILKMSFKTP